jgi:hypothetical protein
MTAEIAEIAEIVITSITLLLGEGLNLVLAT